MDDFRHSRDIHDNRDDHFHMKTARDGGPSPQKRAKASSESLGQHRHAVFEKRVQAKRQQHNENVAAYKKNRKTNEQTSEQTCTAAQMDGLHKDTKDVTAKDIDGVNDDGAKTTLKNTDTPIVKDDAAVCVERGIACVDKPCKMKHKENKPVMKNGEDEEKAWDGDDEDKEHHSLTEEGDESGEEKYDDDDEGMEKGEDECEDEYEEEDDSFEWPEELSDDHMEDDDRLP